MSEQVLTSSPPCPCSWIPTAPLPQERDLGFIPRIKPREGSDEFPCWTLFCKRSQSLFPTAILGLAVAAQTLPTPEAPQTVQITEYHPGKTWTTLRNHRGLSKERHHCGASQAWRRALPTEPSRNCSSRLPPLRARWNLQLRMGRDESLAGSVVTFPVKQDLRERGMLFSGHPSASRHGDHTSPGQ